MDNKGFISVEYLFSMFIILIIACGLLFFSASAIESSNNIGNNVNHRLVLDDVANSISQVNSNGAGYSKHIDLPDLGDFYEITVDKDKLTISYGSKKGETLISLIKIDSKYKLYGGHSYWIEKTEDEKIVIT